MLVHVCGRYGMYLEFLGLGCSHGREMQLSQSALRNFECGAARNLSQWSDCRLKVCVWPTFAVPFERLAHLQAPFSGEEADTKAKPSQTRAYRGRVRSCHTDK